MNHKSKEEIIKLLKTDLDTFYKWQEQFCSDPSQVGLFDLTNIDLRGIKLPRFAPRRIDFSGSNFSSTDFTESVFLNIKLENVDLSNACFRQARLVHCILIDANCSESNFAGTELKGGDLRGTSFKNAHLYNTKFLGVRNFSLSAVNEAKSIEDAIIHCSVKDLKEFVL